MSWHYTCNNKKFIDKIAVLREHNVSKQAVKFVTPKEFDSFDFSVEPKETLDELCTTRAWDLRKNNEKIVIWYSGGCDSHYIFTIFLKHNIKIDEIVMVKSGFKDADYEIDRYAIPFARATNIKFTVRQPDISYYEDFYINKKPMLGSAHNMWHHFRLNNHFENLKHCDIDGVANIFGKEKPTLDYINGKWYTYLLDGAVTPQPNQINFFCDDPKIHSKQSHMLMNRIELMKQQSEYAHLTKNLFKEQDFWNRAIGRYDKDTFPVKYLSYQDQYNQKDALAIRQAPEHIVEAWKNYKLRLVEDIGSQHFNNGDPGRGTVGVFSPFYCLSEKGHKTVDDLYPEGYKT